MHIYMPIGIYVYNIYYIYIYIYIYIYRYICILLDMYFQCNKDNHNTRKKITMIGYIMERVSNGHCPYYAQLCITPWCYYYNDVCYLEKN